MADGELVLRPETAPVKWVPAGRIVQHENKPDPDSRLSLDDWRYVWSGVPANTRKTYRHQWLRWLKWCGDHGFRECPAEVGTVVRWIRANWTMKGRDNRPMAPATIQLSLNVIAVAHKRAAQPDGTTGFVSPTYHPDVHNAFRAYVRDWLHAGHRPDTAHPISPDEQGRLVATCDTRSPVGLLAATALTLDYDMGARASEVCAINWEDVEIHVADLAAVTEEDFLIVHVPMSKTDQRGEGDTVVLYAHPESDAATCPVRTVIAWMWMCRERGIQSGPLLRTVLHGNKAPADGRPKKGTISDIRLPYAGLNTIFHRAIDAAGLPPESLMGRRHHYALHGMRAGSITAVAELEDENGRGVSTAAVYEHFRFSIKSPVALRYMRHGRKKSQNPVRRVWRRRAKED